MLKNSLEYRLFLVLLVVVTLAFGWILLPYYGAVFWAVVLAILFMPVQKYLLRRMPTRRNLAALLTTLSCLLIAILPVVITIGMLVQEGALLYQQIESGELNFNEQLESLWNVLPASLQGHLERMGVGSGGLRGDLSSMALDGSKLFAGKALSIGQDTFSFVVAFFVMLYLLFFFLRDGVGLQRTMHRAIPLGESQKRRLTSKFTRVVRATVKGNLLIALIQGALGGITLGLLGVPSAALLGVVMALLSLVPAVGAGLVWLPIALYMLFSGDLVRGGILVAVGVLVIGMVDNLLRPILVGKDTKMPDYLVLISTLGGLALLGLNGFVIGPLVAALFLSSWSIFASPDQRHRRVLPVQSAPIPPVTEPIKGE
jgi:predicted PurR-regulated permease PerM